MAGGEGQIKRAQLIGPRNYRTVWQKLHYERAQEMQKAREEAELLMRPVGTEHELVATRGKAVRTAEGWETEVDIQPWRGGPYLLEPTIGRFVEKRPYNLLERAQQCWDDRGTLDLRDVDMATAAEAGAKRAAKKAISGGAKAGAIGWLGGGAEVPAVIGGAAVGGVRGFAEGAAWSAVDQMCRPKSGRR